MLNLDTHIVLLALEGDLSRKEKRTLGADDCGISAIVLWEIAKLAQLRRIQIDLDTRELVEALSTLLVWPVDLAVCREIAELDFRGDPADELIAATSIVHGVPLVTRDRAIRASKIVPLAC